MVGVAPHLHAAMRAALRAHLRCLNFDLFSGSLARRRVISPRLNASKRKANFFITAWKKTGSRWDACSYRALPPTESHDRSTTLCRPQAIHHLCVWKWWAYTRWQARTHTCMHARTRTQAASRHARTHSHAYNDSHALTRAHPHFYRSTHTYMNMNRTQEQHTDNVTQCDYNQIPYDERTKCSIRAQHQPKRHIEHICDAMLKANRSESSHLKIIGKYCELISAHKATIHSCECTLALSQHTHIHILFV